MESNKVSSIVINSKDDISSIKLADSDGFKIANVTGNNLRDQNLKPKLNDTLESETTIKVEDNDVVLLETTESNEVREVKNDIDEMTYILGI